MEVKMYKKMIVDIDGTISYEDYTAEEIVAKEKEKEFLMAREAEVNARATAKAALLTRLGITADEAKLLLS